MDAKMKRRLLAAAEKLEERDLAQVVELAEAWARMAGKVED